MSDLLIKNMEMPKRCKDCFALGILKCQSKNKVIEVNMTGQNRPYDCPLIEVPPHGRLGDLDIMKEAFEQTALIEASRDKGNEQIYLDRVKLVHGIIDRTPTVLGASKEEE